MRTREQEIAPLVNLSQISEIELVILKRMREFTLGEHRSLFHGNGFDFVGLRNWEAGDRFEHIDWAQSRLTNFSPLVIRDFEQPSTAGVVVVADHSRSTRCGVDALPEGVAGPAAARGNVLIAHAVARAIATIGMSAVFFQDTFGMVTFQGGLRPAPGDPSARRQEPGDPLPRRLPVRGRARGSAPTRQPQRHRWPASCARPRSCRSSPTSCSTTSQPVLAELARAQRPARRVPGHRRRDVRLSPAVGVGRLGRGGRRRDRPRRGWCRAGSCAGMAEKVRGWQDDVAARRGSAGLDVLRLDLDDTRSDIALAEFAVERRLRKR